MAYLFNKSPFLHFSFFGKTHIRLLLLCVCWFFGISSLYAQTIVFSPVWQTDSLGSYCVDCNTQINGSWELEKRIEINSAYANHQFSVQIDSLVVGLNIPMSISNNYLNGLTCKVITENKRFYLIIAMPAEVNGQSVVYAELSLQLAEPLYESSDNIYKNKKNTHSVLESGTWFKIKVAQDGLYKLTFDQLRSMGFDNPSNLRLFGYSNGALPELNSDYRPDDLPENRLYFGDQFVLMYLKGPNTIFYNEKDDMWLHTLHPYSEYAYYFLTDDASGRTDNRVSTQGQPQGIATRTVSEFTQVKYHELEEENLVLSGRKWYGELFYTTLQHDVSFEFENLVSNTPLKIKAGVLARSKMQSRFTFSTTNFSDTMAVASVIFNEVATRAREQSKVMTTSWNSGNSITISTAYNQPSADSKGWLDYLTLNVNQKLIVSDKSLVFRQKKSNDTPELLRYKVSSSKNNLLIWNVSDLQTIQQMSATYAASVYDFVAATDTLDQTFVAFDSSADFPSPLIEGDGTGLLANQNLHGRGQPDMVIVAHPLFLAQANELADIHRTHDNFAVEVLTPEQIYNEFSSGTPDPSAIRDCIKMWYDRAATQEDMPKYLLLFGDGSFDYKKHSTNNPNFVITYQSENSLSPTQSFVTDDFFGLLDDYEGGSDGLLDIGIGRFPVKTVDQAQDAVDKVKRYLATEAYGDWRNRLCFIADDADGNETIHQVDANRLADYVSVNYPDFSIQKVYLDAYPQTSAPYGQRYPDAQEAINRQVKQGLLILNYTGHGNEHFLTDEHVLSTDDIELWNNGLNMPIFVTATCEFGRFDHYLRESDNSLTSAGELAFLKPDGGTIAMFTTTRLVYASSNYELNSNFYHYVFEKDDQGNYYRFGDIVKLAKRATGTGINKRNFTLLGDPALRIPVPVYQIHTDSINGNSVLEQIDTLRALSKVTISGYITDRYGNPASGYQGILYPTVFDKTDTISTLRNDGAAALEFTLQSNILYKGKATIKNGRFQFSFIVPKDITYLYGAGKISYYALPELNSSIPFDAKGAFDGFFIGGSAPQANADTQGPDIRLFMNDISFVNGGNTHESPVLLAYLYDKNGINTVGNGIGHDITATLDGTSGVHYVLNDAYEADINSYQSGRVYYQLSNLNDGNHTLHVKAWDTYNNSSQASVDFVVIHSNNLVISQVINFPNPVSDETYFKFAHNQPGKELDVTVEIYSMTGNLVQTIKNQSLSDTYQSLPMYWDGRTSGGRMLESGLYAYKIIVTQNNTGKQTEAYGKLILVK